MGSKAILSALCLLGALAAVACSDDDAVNTGGGGATGTAGKGNAGAAGKAGAATGGGETGGGSTGGSAGVGPGGGEAGEAGAAGTGGGCTNFSTFVHTVISQDTNATSAPRPVNNVTFCDTPADPAAFNDLF